MSLRSQVTAAVLFSASFALWAIYIIFHGSDHFRLGGLQLHRYIQPRWVERMNLSIHGNSTTFFGSMKFAGTVLGLNDERLYSRKNQEKTTHTLKNTIDAALSKASYKRHIPNMTTSNRPPDSLLSPGADQISLLCQDRASRHTDAAAYSRRHNESLRAFASPPVAGRQYADAQTAQMKQAAQARARPAETP